MTPVANEWNRIAESFDETRQHPWQECLDFIAGCSGTGLDVGCGNGRHLIPLARRCSRVIGLDSAPAMATVSRKNVQEHGLDNVDVVVADATMLPIADDTADCILFIAALHNIPGRSRRIAALQELRRVLKPNGEALVSVWSKWQDRWRWQSLRQLLTPWQRAGNVMVPWKKDDMQVERFYHLYGRWELRRDIRQAGLHGSRIWSVKKASRRHPDNHFAVVTKTRGAPARE
ncbi:MAG: class I SAM-dependent methyltransferase [Thermoplasmatota archaeon]